LVDEIIQPKVIIALGIDPFYCLKNKKEVEIIVVNDKLTIKKSFRNDIPIYYIPNPSVFNINKYYKPTNILDLRKILENIF
jgi:uracil-DNA glycosylase